MQITVSNCSNQPDTRVLQVIRAINRQIREDFRPYWSMDAQLRLSRRPDGPVDPHHLADLRGDAVLYLFDAVQDEADAGILGLHDENFRGVPFGFVFTEISEQLGEDW